MSHLSAQKKPLVLRVRRIKGQLEAVERALEGEVECAAVLQQVAAVRGAITGVMGELVEDHLREHVSRTGLDQTQRDAGAAELAEVLKRYWK